MGEPGEAAHLVQGDQEPGVTPDAGQRRDELQVVVELGVVDDERQTQSAARPSVIVRYSPLNQRRQRS